VGGSDASYICDEGEYTITSPPTENHSVVQTIQQVLPVTARLVVDNSDDYVESLEEKLQQQHEALRHREEELARMQQNQENIVVGQVLGVHNNDEDGDEEEGTNNDNSTALNEPMCTSKQKVIVGVLAVLVIIAVIVGVIVATSSNSRQNASNSESSPTVESSPVNSPTAPPAQTPMSLPTLPPTAAPTSTVSGLIELLSLVSPDGGTAIALSSTPQSKAVNWLANNTNLDLYSDKRKIQRYALAVFYYSTNGEYWSNKAGWLNYGDECDWYTLADVSFCDATGKIVEVDFYDGNTENGNNLVGTIPNELAMLSDSLGKRCLWYQLLHDEKSSYYYQLLYIVAVLVDELVLPKNNMEGSIATEIGLLNALSESILMLIIAMFSLHSTLILIICPFTAQLQLFNNTLTGQIPSEIGKLTAMGESCILWILVVSTVVALLLCSMTACLLLSLFYS
jgi:hypothetical protein